MIQLQQSLTIDDYIKISNLASIIWYECYKELLEPIQIDYMLNKFLSTEAIIANIEEGYIYELIYFDNNLAGFTAYKHEDVQNLYLSKLYILETYRQKHISSFIINYLKDFKKNISLNVNKYNTRAISCYEHFGFITIDSQVNDIGNNYVMDDYVMMYSK